MGVRPKDMSLIFLHIGKTAGTTLVDIVTRQYPQESILRVDGFGKYGRRLREAAYQLKTISEDDWTRVRVRACIEQFKRLPQNERAKLRCLMGHMYFGLHEYLPGPTAYITMLRDPIDRVISHYYYVLRTPGHRLHKEVVSRNMDLGEYVTSGITSELCDGQVRALRGIESVLFGDDPVSEETLKIAKKNVSEHFMAVGLLERFDESLILFSKLLGWRNIYYVGLNVAKKRPSRVEVSREIVGIIEKQNELDMELYEFAGQILENRLREQQVNKKALRAFRIRNKIYGVARGLLSKGPMKDVKTLLKYQKQLP